MRWEALWPARDVKVWEGGGWEGGWPRRGDPGLSRLVSPSQELSSYGHQRTDFLLQQQQGKQHNSGRHQKFVKTASLPGLPLTISISYQEFVDLARIVNFWRLMLHWIYSLLYLQSFLSHVKRRICSDVFKKLDWQPLLPFFLIITFNLPTVHFTPQLPPSDPPSCSSPCSISPVACLCCLVRKRSSEWKSFQQEQIVLERSARLNLDPGRGD